MSKLLSETLKGRRALVTGGNRGIGRAIALQLAEAGADIMINFVGSEAEAEATAAECRAFGVQAACCYADISKEEDVTKLFAEMVQQLGGVDILVNNAGFFYDVVPLIDMTDAQVSKTIDINLKGTMYMSREVCKRLVDAGLPGRVVNITSGAAHSGRVNFSNYCASKAGVLGLTRAMALELAPKRINVNSVTVGYVEVGLWDGDAERNKVKDSIIPRILLRRPGGPRDISRMVCFLASECGDWITGSDFKIDGGESCGRVPFTD